MAKGRGMLLIDTIGPTLDTLIATSAANVAEAMSQGRGEVESYAKTNAPWADRTGAARNGLTASVYLEGGEIVLELAHTVDYGYWLEVIQEGRFATIMPTLEALGSKIVRDAGGQIMAVRGVL